MRHRSRLGTRNRSCRLEHRSGRRLRDRIAVSRCWLRCKCRFRRGRGLRCWCGRARLRSRCWNSRLRTRSRSRLLGGSRHSELCRRDGSCRRGLWSRSDFLRRSRFACRQASAIHDVFDGAVAEDFAGDRQYDRLGVGARDHLQRERRTFGESDRQCGTIIGLSTRILQQRAARGLGRDDLLHDLGPFALQLARI